MNKGITILILVLAIILIAYNATLVDFKNPLEGDSLIAAIGIIASLCAIVLILILITSRKIKNKVDEN